MQPLLAAFDIGSLFAIAFLLISFIGWIMNLINSQNPPPQPNRPPQPPQPRNRKVQTEIEDFLQQAMGRRSPQPQRPQPGQGDSGGIEIIEPQQQRRPPSRRSPQKASAGPLPNATAGGAEPAARPGDNIASRRSVASSDLGKGVRSHLQQHMQPRVGQEAEQHLPHDVETSIAQHLGQFRAADSDTRRGVAPQIRSRAAVKGADHLIADLRKRGGMRRAIILQEVLSKPRALRKG